MKADLTRTSFDPLKHFSRVIMQQGRVQLDADWNEQAAIQLHFMRRLLMEAMPAGGGSGFGIGSLDTTPNPVADDFAIGAGAYFAGGLLCELEATPIAVMQPKGVGDKKIIQVSGWTVDGVPFQKDQYLEITDVAVDDPAPLVIARITDLDYAAMRLTLDTDVKPASPSKAKLTARRLVTYRSQPDPADPLMLANGNPVPLPVDDKGSQVYLDVWERVVTCLEDDSIREVALNGPDTAARARVVWSVRMTPYLAPAVRPSLISATVNRSKGPSGAALGSGNNSGTNGVDVPNDDSQITCMTVRALENLIQPLPVGRMRARTQPAQLSPDPCTISPDSRYRGPENQLYRVEIQTGSPNGPSFKWSRENGAVVFPVLKLAPGTGVTTVTLGSLGRDERFGLAEGDYVEVQDDRSVVTNTVGPLLQVQSIDRTSMTVILNGTVPTPVGSIQTLHPLLRRWDQKAGDPAEGGSDLGTDGAVPIAAGTWQNLEDGVQVLFPDADGISYRPSDYWLIPARVATGDVIWPQESGVDVNGNTIVNPVAKLPDGIKHHYAPLGVVMFDAAKTLVFKSCMRSDRSM